LKAELWDQPAVRLTSAEETGALTL